MGNNVFANGREISCKAADGKSICAFPDVCMTPPENPATPPGVPIPYPNTGMAKDTAGGSKKVKISGKEIMLKNQSHFKKSMGDEAGSAAKKGVVTSVNRGKIYFTSWSMDVKFEGKNVVRHLDMTTHNHASQGPNTPPWAHVDTGVFAKSKDCQKDRAEEKRACKDYEPHKSPGLDVCKEAGLSGAFTYDKATITKRTNSANANDCLKARRCRLVPYDAEPRDGIHGCCPAQTPDHIIPKSSFFKTSAAKGDHFSGWDEYNKGDKAPCMCAEGGVTTGSHGLRHAHHKAYPPKVGGKEVEKGDELKWEKQVDHCADGASKVSGCDKKCLKAQLKAGHKDLGNGGKTKYSPSAKKGTSQATVDAQMGRPTQTARGG